MADVPQQEGATPEAPPPPPPPPQHVPAGWGPPPGWGQVPPWGAPPAPTPYGWHPSLPAQLPGSGRFRAMGVGELLDAVFTLYRKNFLLIAAISAIVQIPYAVIQFAVYQLTGLNTLQSNLQSAQQSLQQNPDQPPSTAQLQTVLGDAGTVLLITSLVALIAVFIVLPLAEAATTRAVSDRYLDQPASIGSSYAAAIRRLVPLITQSLILFLGFAIVFAAAVLVIVILAAASPGAGIAVAIFLGLGLIALALLVYVRTSLAAPAIVLENLSGWRGLVRSWRLVEGMFWRIFGIRLLIALITGIISGIVVLLLTVPGAALGGNARFMLQQAASAIASVFISPITYIAVTLLYYDARIRKEGFDIEMLAKSL